MLDVFLGDFLCGFLSVAVKLQRQWGSFQQEVVILLFYLWFEGFTQLGRSQTLLISTCCVHHLQ